ncbi:class I SAM-dependent methyltransferase [Streptomyces sp. HSW2009]|uniref:class I SAM-dependent methyltransferase n=1 Tax=Streptomyces sp. HSW2009 TaxID=3142890 RepID=UPI0032EC276F
MTSELSDERAGEELRAMASTAGYGEAAASLVEQYEGVSFDDVHREVLDLIPQRPLTVLDVGAGSGRDAAALAARGHAVVAAEPTPELRALGRARHADQPVQWVDDAFPDLPGLTAQERRFDLILSTAVWMHLDAEQRTAAMATLVGLLAAGGQLVLTLRHGPVPAGRRMFAVSGNETIELAQRHGLTVAHHSHRADLHGRSGVEWTQLVLRHAPLHHRQATDGDLPALVALRDHAARWQIAHGIAQWRPGELGVEHFRERLRAGEVWLATLGPHGPIAGGWELWWDDPAAWGDQPPVAGYVHRLMTDRRVAPPGTGRHLLAHAESRIAAAGRTRCRLDSLSANAGLRTYYERAGYRAVGENVKGGGPHGTYGVTLWEKDL